MAPTVPSSADFGINYSVHAPSMTQVLTARSFHYFKLYLFDIERFLTKQQPWNPVYPAAIKIYSDDPQSAVLRNAIHTEHAVLYSGREGRMSSKHGVLQRSPADFFKLLDENKDKYILPFIKESNELAVYTYAMMPDSWRFSRTGASVTIDFSSKHALHAGASPFVMCAGEFWIDGDLLYIDNNSGTFAPPKELLEPMAELLRHNFPGLKVKTLDYQDPEWKRLRSK